MLANLLQPGDTIEIISPSAILKEKDDLEELEKAIKMMENAGFKIIKGKYAFSNETGYGTRAIHKAEDLNNAFANEEIKAIFSITGGADCISTFDYIDWKIIKNNPKIICGFSDTVALLNEINQKTGLITFMGPSFKSIGSGKTKYRFNAVINRFVKGNINLAEYEDLNEFEVIREGKAQGKAIGGNLSLTTALASGKYKIDFKNTILLLEEFAYESNAEMVSNNLYRLKQEGIFDEISGIWIGNYDGDIKLDEILLNVIDDITFNKPIIKSNNFGHCEKKIVIPIGTELKIDTKEQSPYVWINEKFLK